MHRYTGYLAQNASMIRQLRIRTSAVAVDVSDVSYREKLKATLKEDPVHKMIIGKKGENERVASVVRIRFTSLGIVQVLHDLHRSHYLQELACP